MKDSLLSKIRPKKTGFCLKRNELLVKREGRHRKQPTEMGKVHTHSLGGGEMKTNLVSPRTQAKNSPVKLMLYKRQMRRTTGNMQIINIEPTKHRRG